MRTEVPNLQKCCFCLPLRYGLLGWGYIKLFLCLFLLTSLLITTIRKYALVMSTSASTYYTTILSVILLMDIIFNFVFVIGGHKINKLIRIYYYYLLVQITLNAIIFVVNAGIGLYIFRWHGLFIRMEVDAFAMFYYLMLNIYILFLLRGEMVKFRGSRKFVFTYNATENEAQCNLNIQ